MIEANVGFINDRCEIDHGVTSPDLLKELTGSAHHRPSEMLRLAIRKQITNLLFSFHRFEGFLDNSFFQDSLFGAEGGVGQGRYDALTFFFETLREEPSGRFGEKEDAYDEEDDKDELEADGNAPGYGVVYIAEAEILGRGK